MNRIRLAALTVVLLSSLASPASSIPRLPHRVVWRGTITAAGETNMLVARTRLVEGRDIEPHYPGRFRCRGSGCPARRGHIEFIPTDSRDRIYEIFFGARRPRAIYCVYDNNSAPAVFAIDGDFACHTVVPPEPPPVQVVATGTLALAPSRVPQPR